MPNTEQPIEVTYNGRLYRRYPHGKQRAHRVYYVPTGPGAGGAETLHRQIWSDHNGPIPAGCDVHHRDEDPFNNDPGNLVCVTRVAHQAEHYDTAVAVGRSDEHQAHLER